MVRASCYVTLLPSALLPSAESAWHPTQASDAHTLRMNMTWERLPQQGSYYYIYRCFRSSLIKYVIQQQLNCCYLCLPKNAQMLAVLLLNEHKLNCKLYVEKVEDLCLLLPSCLSTIFNNTSEEYCAVWSSCWLKMTIFTSSLSSLISSG